MTVWLAGTTEVSFHYMYGKSRIPLFDALYMLMVEFAHKLIG
jgi:hypothetical protein